MYPLKFKKHFVEKIWGGRGFEEALDMKLPTADNYGESWEVSSHKNGMSYVENGSLEGKSLQELVDQDGAALLGEEIYNRFKGKFPVLIKYLDVNDRLSVQVHPSDEYALRVEKEFGKSESWYIIEASEDARLIMGLKEGITKEEFLTKAKANDFTDMFNIVSVKRGDFINVNPGLVHASLEGSVVICETQQNSDTTYRIYDFDRKVNGVARELHLDKASDVINFNEKPEITTNDSREKIALEGAQKEILVRGEYFNIDKLMVEGVFRDEINENFKVYSILEGEGKILHSGKEYEIRKGDTYFIPAGLDVSVEGRVEILKSFL
ncbi:mannose-6-phosphate isomerase [Propionigenium maris DSM 9537]|uniref:Phosphohexomutase n=1 Tax=Propionigenium maris DSM 9537 TaxID=1123000 RepID=A0A9W6GJQ3_9FUSO|nr:type I phosphomannose isomerase catalytic subunit [Propionigenium maris]GLI55420.1 mannose-6-phosphate isomerase [Propionigenium maris DSM 9537]